MKKHLLLLFQLLIVSRSRVCAAPVEAAQPSALYILRGRSTDYWCRHDASIDVSGAKDLAVSVQDCAKSLEIALQESDVSALAAVLGRQTLNLPSYKSVFGIGPGDEAPTFRANQNHPLIRDGSVTVLHGNSSAIALTVRDRPETQSLCVVCGQVGRTLNYVTTDKRRIRVVSRPEARMAMNNRELAADYTSDVEIRSGDSFALSCSGVSGGSGGGGRLSVRLEKSGRIIASSVTETVTHSVTNASSADSGSYQCYAKSDLAHLADAGEETGSIGCSLIVSFPPRIEVDEVVRFTRLGEMEEIQVRVTAYPEPQLSCLSKAGDSVSSSDPPSSTGNRLTVKERFSPSSFYTAFIVNFGNLNEVANETLITCTAHNILGSREVEIRLTALAPTPEIVSGAGTSWWNSYDLRWQHHVKANVDYYRIRVAYVGANNEVNKTEQRLQNFKQTDDHGKGLRQVKDLVFNLSPDTVHNISLQACNKHGCSSFSNHVRVHTARESVEAYNDPRHPVFAEPQSDRPRDSAVRDQSPVCTVQLMSIVGCFALLMRANLQ